MGVCGRGGESVGGVVLIILGKELSGCGRKLDFSVNLETLITMLNVLLHDKVSLEA